MTTDPHKLAASPVRVQLSRKAGWRMPPNTVKVDRTTMFGNPFFSDPGFPRSRAFEVMLFRDWIQEQLGAVRIGTAEQREFRQFMQQMSCTDVTALKAKGERMKAGLHLLRGKNLACWCALDQPCHADVLMELANAAVRAVLIEEVGKC